jgi:hypothetical protein
MFGAQEAGPRYVRPRPRPRPLPALPTSPLLSSARILMADDRKSIPSWQKAVATPHSPSESKSEPEDVSDAQQDDIPSPRHQSGTDEGSAFDSTELMLKEVDQMPPMPTREDAAKFLEHPGTEKASLEDKVRFLELKGVGWDDIVALLPDAASLKPKTALVQSSPAPQSAISISPAAVPPVVTYPEFLVQPQKPAPLVTTSFVIKTLYGTASAAAGMYALSKYMLAPMHDGLTDSRHDFFSHTSDKLSDFTSRLRRIVSAVPVKEKDLDPEDNVSVSSDDSDPTELFHRDMATQTTPSLSRSPSINSVSDLPVSTVDLHANRISTMAAQIRSLDSSRSGSEPAEMQEELTGLSNYLNDMMYASPYYGFKNSAPPTWQPPGTATKLDEFDRFKAEIRSMKGAMLSTRNFPRSAVSAG